ncbi:MAG: response regulator [Patescibacteria group bacterium]|jgi:CheY-like chemotaxis protein
MDGKKILIVEDNETLLKALEKKLLSYGYEVLLARDGAEGLTAIQNSKPDVVLLDILMPNVDGFTVLEKLHNDNVIPALPIIIVSNSGQPVEIDRAIKLGARDYLVKAEFDPEEVVEKVRKVLGQPSLMHSASTNNVDTPVVIPSKDSKRILVVEDDQFLRDLLQRKLKAEGFLVETAIEGEGALEITKKTKPDLILLDIILPGIDGFTILERLKQDPDLAMIPVILLTNLGQRDDVDKGLKLGAVGYLVKAHFTPGDIVEKVRSTLKMT